MEQYHKIHRHPNKEKEFLDEDHVIIDKVSFENLEEMEDIIELVYNYFDVRNLGSTADHLKARLKMFVG